MALSKHRKIVVKKSLKEVSSLLLGELDEMLDQELNQEKRLWARDWLQRRPTHGASSLLLKELASEDVKEYMSALRMSPINFQDLLSLVESNIRRQDTLMRDSIPANVKLEITLSFLATGNSYRSLSHMFRVSKPAISKLVPEVCAEIYKALNSWIKVSTIF